MRSIPSSPDRRDRRRATIAVGAAAVGIPLLLLAFVLNRDDPRSTSGTGPAPTVQPFDPTRTTVGRPAPEFALPSVDGRPVRLADFRGRPVVLNFFASWCRPCEKEMPVLDAIARDGRVAVVAVSFRDSPGDARNFARRLDVDFPVLVDDDTASAVARAYGVRSPPMTFFIGADGRIGAPAVYGGAGPADLGPGLARIAPGVTPPS